MNEVDLAEHMEKLMSHQLERVGQLPELLIPLDKGGGDEVEQLLLSPDLEVNLMPIPLEIPYDWIRVGTDLVEAWSDWAITQESTWIGRHHGVASPIMRIDGTLAMQPDNSVGLVPYEVEVRPSGLGIATSISPEISSRLEAVRSHWPDEVRDATVVVDEGGIRLDDHLWHEGSEESLEEAIHSDSLLLVRNNTNNSSDHLARLSERAISPITSDGLKTHAATLGMAAVASSVEELVPWMDLLRSIGTVIKPVKGAYAQSVSIHSNAAKQERPRGTVTSGRLIRDAKELIDRDGSVLVQPLVPPLAGELGPNSCKILRLYWANDLAGGGWLPLGGLAVTRDNIRVHGTSDAITQAVEVAGAPTI